MWRFSAVSSVILVTILWYLVLVPSRGTQAFYSPADIAANNYEQLNALVKDYLKVMERVKGGAHYKPISGQVNLRAPRSELGDMANNLRLFQLQELDRMYGSKSRPRFGKRNEVTQDDVPSYGSGYEASSNGIPISPDEERR